MHILVTVLLDVDDNDDIDVDGGLKKEYDDEVAINNIATSMHSIVVISGIGIGIGIAMIILFTTVVDVDVDDDDDDRADL